MCLVQKLLRVLHTACHRMRTLLGRQHKDSFFLFVFCSLVEAFGKMQESELTTSRVAHRVLDVSEEAIVGNRVGAFWLSTA